MTAKQNGQRKRAKLDLLPRRSWSVPEVAHVHRVSEKTIRRMIDAGKIETFRLGGQVRIRDEVMKRIENP